MEPGQEEAGATFRFADLAIWRRKLRGVDHSYPVPGGRRTNPLVVDSLLLAAGPRPARLCAVGRGTGRTRWRRRMDDFLHSASLVAVDGIIYGVGGGRLFALRAATGRPVWGHTLRERIWTTDSKPAVVEGYLIIGDWAGVVWCLDGATGEIHWSAMPDPLEKLGVSGAALVHRDLAIVPTITGFAVAYDLRTGHERWRTALDGPCADELVLFRGSVLLRTTASVYLLDPHDGRVVWRWHAGGLNVRECVPAGDLIVVNTWILGKASPDARGELIALSEGQVVYRRPDARWPLGLRHSPETGLIYEARLDGLGLLDPRTGDRLWDLRPGSGGPDDSCGCPDVRDGAIYALTADARLYALRHPLPGETPPHRRARPRPPARPDPPVWTGQLPRALGPSLRAIYETSHGARRTVDFAQDEARRLGHDRIGTEHVLLGILRFGYRMAVTPRGPPSSTEAPDLPLSRRAGRVLRRALEVAETLGHRSIGGEELLLGIVGEEHCTAARALRRLGVPTEQFVLAIQLRWLPDWLARPPVPEGQDPWQEHLSQFSEDLRRALRAAKEKAVRPPYILALEQLLGALLGEDEGPAGLLLREAGADVSMARERLAALVATTGERLPGRHGRPDWLAVTPRVLNAVRFDAVARWWPSSTCCLD